MVYYIGIYIFKICQHKTICANANSFFFSKTLPFFTSNPYFILKKQNYGTKYINTLEVYFEKFVNEYFSGRYNSSDSFKNVRVGGK